MRNRQKQSKTQKTNAYQKIHAALNNKKWENRTIPGLSHAIGIEETLVQSIINEYNNEIRKSLLPNKYGKALYTLKTRKSLLGDIWSSLQKLSNDKF